jgi:hypothetical protein
MRRITTKALSVLMLVAAVVFAAGCKPEDEPNNGGGNQGGGNGTEVTIKVTTDAPKDITETTAVCGGRVEVSQGVTLNELGVCWGTNPNPTADGAHVSTTNWSAPFVCALRDFEPNTVYHVRAYALRDSEYYYGEDKSFKTLENNIGGGDGSGTYNGHDYIDLGLPSGTMWATCNVGANTPENYGDYFAWGETQPKTTYTWTTYQYCNGEDHKLTKYCNMASYGNEGYTDNYTVLRSDDDAATANWGDRWSMPTDAQWQELWANTTNRWTTQNGINGRLITATNGNSIFLPAGGYYWIETLNRVGTDGNYWSSSLDKSGPNNALSIKFYSGNHSSGPYDRSVGYSVRPVFH